MRCLRGEKLSGRFISIMNYLPVNEKEKNEMLAAAGVSDTGELFSVIPPEARIAGLKLPAGVSEQELTKELYALSSRNRSLNDLVCFRGAGVYDHYIPALVEEITGRSEFLTAYTPYQAEASQGTLQAVFEYQSLICALTGLDVANASLYDGASAVAEAALLAARATGRKKIVISRALHPESADVLKTYLQGTGCETVTAPVDVHGATDLSLAASLIDGQAAALIIQSPNFFGTIEDLAAARKAAAGGTLLIAAVNPLSLGVLLSPGEAGADIAVGEGQALGNAPSFGGAGFGFLAVNKALSWKIPGRVVGQTIDADGARGFVLTLQSREQHIRREKATSNICTNAALNALAGCVYLAGLGPSGIRKIAEANLANSRYAFDRLSRLPGFSPAYEKQVFFNEFVLRSSRDNAALQKKLLSKGILGPLDLGTVDPDMKGLLLFCVTEARTKEDIDRLAKVLSE